MSPQFHTFGHQETPVAQMLCPSYYACTEECPWCWWFQQKMIWQQEKQVWRAFTFCWILQAVQLEEVPNRTNNCMFEKHLAKTWCEFFLFPMTLAELAPFCRNKGMREMLEELSDIQNYRSSQGHVIFQLWHWGSRQDAVLSTPSENYIELETFGDLSGTISTAECL